MYKLSAGGLVLAGMAMMPTSIVFAANMYCQFSPNSSVSPVNFNITGSTVQIPPNPPPNMALRTHSLNQQTINRNVYCWNELGGVINYPTVTARLELTLIPPWKTLPGGIATIPGTNLGYRFVGAETSTESTMYLPSFSKTHTYKLDATTTHSSVMSRSQTVELIALGPVSIGTSLPVGNIGYIQPRSSSINTFPGTSYLRYARVALVNIPVTVELHTCKAPSSTVVDLGTHHFTGSTPGVTSPEVDFTIQLTDCPTGVPIRMGWKPSVPSAPTIPAPYTNSIMALDSTSTATGVGIQLLGEEGAEAIIADGTGYTMVTTQSQPTQPLKLSARYMQVAPNVTPGSAKTSGTFTITYP